MLRKIIALNLIRTMVVSLAVSSLIPMTPAIAAKTVEGKTSSRTMVVGLNETIKLDYVPGTVAIGSAKIADYKVFRADKEILLIPKAKGITNITIKDTSRNIRETITLNVTISDLVNSANDLKNLLTGIEGVEIKIVANKILIDGEILLPSDFNRIAAVVSEYDSKEVGVIAALSPLAQKIISEKMEKDLIRSLGGEENVTISVRPLNHQFVIEGIVPSDSIKTRARLIAESYIPDIFSEYGERDKIIKRVKPPSILDLLVVQAPPKPEPKPEAPPPPPKVIKITSYYVELSKDYTKNFSFQWAPGLQQGGGAAFEIGPASTGITSTVTGTIGSLLPKLQRAKELGQARVLREHTVLVSDNKEGRIENITKIPYAVIGPEGTQGTEFVDIGLVTSITPHISEGTKNSIQLKLNFQFNSLQGTTHGRPQTENNNVTTEVVVTSGESAAVGGLISNNMGVDYNKLPIIGTSDPIFNLLRSKDFRHKKSQFIVFIVPEIIESVSKASEPIKNKFRMAAPGGLE